jgi:hypothetical protein
MKPPGGKGEGASRRLDLAEAARAAAGKQGEKGRRRGAGAKGWRREGAGEWAVGLDAMKKGERKFPIP